MLEDPAVADGNFAGAIVFPREAGVELTNGNLGRDLVAQFDSFTLDSAQLRSYLRKKMRI